LQIKARNNRPSVDMNKYNYKYSSGKIYGCRRQQQATSNSNSNSNNNSRPNSNSSGKSAKLEGSSNNNFC